MMMQFWMRRWMRLHGNKEEGKAPGVMPGAKGGNALNSVILCGRLTKDPNMGQTNNGTMYARMTLAVDRRRAKDGQRQADFPTLIAWGKTAEFAEKYLCKGKKILVEGSLQTGSYEKDGVKHYTTDVLVDNIEFADSKRQEDGGDFGGNDDIPY